MSSYSYLYHFLGFLLRLVSLCISQPLLHLSPLQNELTLKDYDCFGQAISNMKANAAGLTQQNNV